jgi:uncharacterized membrane protein YgaE (UPF0421/DUF939 family)
MNIKIIGRKFSEARAWVQRVVITSAAASLAFGVGSLFSTSDAVVAAILAVITLRVSVQASLSEAFIQLLGSLIGVGVAYWGLSIFGSNLITIGVVVLISFLLSKLIGLGDDGGINVAITALIVSAPGLHSDNASSRIWGTMIGVISALLLSYWAHPTSPLVRTKLLTGELAISVADLLQSIAVKVEFGYGSESASGWLKKAREIADSTLVVRSQAEEAIRYAKWSPAASKADARRIYQRYVSLEHSVVQLRNISRTLFDNSLENVSLANKEAKILTNIMELSASLWYQKAIKLAPKLEIKLEQNKNLYFNSGRVSNILYDEFEIEDISRNIDDLIDNATRSLNKITNENELLLFASLLSSLIRINDSYELDNPAVTLVPTPKVTVNHFRNFYNAITKPFK